MRLSRSALRGCARAVIGGYSVVLVGAGCVSAKLLEESTCGALLRC